MKNEKRLIKLSRALSEKVTHKIARLFLEKNNEPMYHNEIHREVGGSKTSVSRALHILSDDYDIYEKYYKSIPIPDPNPHERQISVLMFKMKEEYFDMFKQYYKDLL